MTKAILGGDAARDPRGRAALALLFQTLEPRLARDDAVSLVDRLSGPGLHDPAQSGHVPLIAQLARRGLVVFQALNSAFTIRPLRDHFCLSAAPVATTTPQRLSRFTIMTAEGGTMVVRNPLADRWLELHDPACASWLTHFARPLASAALPDEAHALVAALSAGQMLLPCDEAGFTSEDRDPARRMWELHDLLMHGRSRLGRTESPIGGVYEFRDSLTAEAPLSAPLPISRWFNLPLPDPAPETAFRDVISRRRSVRAFAEDPVTLGQVGALLHLGIGRHADGTRTYPNGGALYEQVFYLAVRGTGDLPRGLYRYDAHDHALGRVAAKDTDVLRILGDAAVTMGVQDPPPMLLIIASQFGRVRWKYRGMAYALQLKHVGVIQEALYLAGTALGLGGCALGSGDSDHFARMTGLDYLREGSIGEFAFGLPGEGSGRDS